MFKQTIKYTDYNGVERTEDFYFNLSKNTIEFKDIRFGELFMDSQSNILLKIDNLSNPDCNAVYLNDGLVTSYNDDETVIKLKYEKDWYKI